MAENLAYREKREAQMQYPQYQAQEWPIGSGMVESGHKQVMQVRLKGPGMHWEPGNVNPMLALRTAVYNDRGRDMATPQQRGPAPQARAAGGTHTAADDGSAKSTARPLDAAASRGPASAPAQDQAGSCGCGTVHIHVAPFGSPCRHPSLATPLASP